MASNFITMLSANPLLPERVTNLNTQYAELVQCPICSCILWKPVTCNLCENSFCFECIQMWLYGQEQQINESAINENENNHLINSLSLIRCPLNCLPYQQRRCSPLLTTILSKLTIQCRNKLNGCQEILFYEQLEKHEEELCQYTVVRCPGCQQDMFKELFEKDQHLFNCSYVELQCIKCKTIFQQKEEHNEFECFEKQIDFLKQELSIFQQKSGELFNIQRKKIDIINEKFDIIEEVWGIDEINVQIADMNNSVSMSTEVRRKWKVIRGILLTIFCISILLIYIRIFLY